MPSKENYSNDVAKREVTMQKFSSFITEWKRGEDRKSSYSGYNRRERRSWENDRKNNVKDHGHEFLSYNRKTGKANVIPPSAKTKHYQDNQSGRFKQFVNKEAYQPHQMSLSRMRTLDRRDGSYSKDRDPESNKAKKHVVTDYRRGDKLTTLKKKMIKLPYDSNRARVGRSAIRTSNKKFNANKKSIPMWNRMGARPSVKEAYQAHQMSTSRFKKFVDKHNPGVPDTDKKIFHDTIKKGRVNRNADDAHYRTFKSNGKFAPKVGRAMGRLAAKSLSLSDKISNLAGKRKVSESAPNSVRDMHSLNAKKAGKSIKVSRSKMDNAHDKYIGYLKKDSGKSIGNTNRKLRNLNNVQNKYDPGRRTMTKTTLNRALRPYPKPAERSLMDTAAKKAERAKRKVGINASYHHDQQSIEEASPKFIKRLTNIHNNPASGPDARRGAYKLRDININAKLDRAERSGSWENDKRKDKHITNVYNKYRPENRWVTNSTKNQRLSQGRRNGDDTVRFKMNTKVKKAERAKRKVGINSRYEPQQQSIKEATYHTLHRKSSAIGKMRAAALGAEFGTKSPNKRRISQMRSSLKRKNRSLGYSNDELLKNNRRNFGVPSGHAPIKMDTTAKKAERAKRKIGLRKESSTDIGSVSKVRKILGTDGRTSKAIKTISNKQVRNARANSLLAKHGNDLPSDSRRSNRFKRLRGESAVNESRTGTRERGDPKDLFWNRRQRTASIKNRANPKALHYKKDSKDRFFKRIRWAEPINVRKKDK